MKENYRTVSFKNIYSKIPKQNISTESSKIKCENTKTCSSCIYCKTYPVLKNWATVVF